MVLGEEEYEVFFINWLLRLVINFCKGGKDPWKAHSEGWLHWISREVEELRGDLCVNHFRPRHSTLPHSIGSWGKYMGAPGQPRRGWEGHQTLREGAGTWHLYPFQVTEVYCKSFLYWQELKGHAAAKAQGQNNKRTYAKVNMYIYIEKEKSRLLPQLGARWRTGEGACKQDSKGWCGNWQYFWCDGDAGSTLTVMKWFIWWLILTIPLVLLP